MLRRVLMIGIALGVGIAALHIGTAHAQWQYLRPPGMWWYYGSINGCGTITQVRNPDKFPARLHCDVTVTKVESLCENPSNHDVRPGEAATQIVFSADNDIDWDDFLDDKRQKEKGKVELCVEITSADADCKANPDHFLCDREFCVNPNWWILQVLTTEFLAECRTDQCTGTYDETTKTCSEWSERDTQVCQCALPAGHDWPPRPGTPYECDEVELIGGLWVPTGNSCELQ